MKQILLLGYLLFHLWYALKYGGNLDKASKAKIHIHSGLWAMIPQNEGPFRMILRISIPCNKST